MPGDVWQRGLGDVAVALKHATYHSLERGRIFSLGGEVVLATGKETLGLGRGVTVFEPFVAFGQILQGDAFLQAQAGVELPADRDRAAPEAFWRGVIGQTVFSSGALEPSGLIRGNDNDADPARFEPHYTEIRRHDEVQVYESVMHDASGSVTTGLLQATGYAKDNRLLPRGCDKATAPADIAVMGGAREDPDFTAGGDRVRYIVDTEHRAGPFRVDVALRYQPIGFRWAQNLRPYDAMETRRFVSWFEAMSSGSAVLLTRTSASLSPVP